jgi:hypothetical protein
VDIADDAAQQLIETPCSGQSGEEILDKALKC